MDLLKLFVGIIPIFIFLIILIGLDSFKLVSFKLTIKVILLGGTGALISLLLNRILNDSLGFGFLTYTHYVGPVIEETIKAMVLIYFIRSEKIGFIVDAAIFGFATGTGFALIENIYQYNVAELNIQGWILRGLGTAVMHGASTAIFAIIAKSFVDRKMSIRFSMFLPAIGLAIIIHSFFNHLLLPPEVLTIVELILLPILFWIIFLQSEKAIHHWIDIGLDAEVGLLEFLVSGKLSETKIGRFLDSLIIVFPKEKIADILCYLRVYLELSTRVKGILLMQQSGFVIPPDPDIKERLKELDYLESRIGKTGKRALETVFESDPKDLWQLYLLKNR